MDTDRYRRRDEKQNKKKIATECNQGLITLAIFVALSLVGQPWATDIMEDVSGDGGVHIDEALLYLLVQS